MNDLKNTIELAQLKLREMLLEAIENDFDIDNYQRFLSMQYHLTQGVQKHFFAIAGHQSLLRHKALRKFLINFAHEEEMHYLVAEKDLQNLGREPLPASLDVQIWWAYFDKVIVDRPLMRLGAMCILENILSKSDDLVAGLLQSLNFIKANTAKFITIHRHGPELAHGDDVLRVLEENKFSDSQWQDINEGAQAAATMYLRSIEWVMQKERKVYLGFDCETRKSQAA